MRRFRVVVLAGLVGALASSGCAGVVAGSPGPASSSPARTVQVSSTFATTPGTAVTYDATLVPAGARGAVSSRSADGTTTVMLDVSGLGPDRRYGAHAHAKPCGAKGEDAGPHFQYDVDPVQPSVDPQYANAENEVRLDLTTDSAGAGAAEATVAWAFPADRRAKSVIIHAMPTATDPGKAGTAGARAACISVEF